MSLLFNQQDPPTAEKIETQATKVIQGLHVILSALANTPSQGLGFIMSHVQETIPKLLHNKKALKVQHAKLQDLNQAAEDYVGAVEEILEICPPKLEQLKLHLQTAQNNLAKLQVTQGLQGTPSRMARAASGVTQSAAF